MNLDDIHDDTVNHLYEKKFMNHLFKGVRTIFLLWLISQEKIHGYKIISLINEMLCSEKNEKVVHGSTIYPLLHSLENKGFIKSSNDYNGKKQVKLYEITDDGIKLLNSIKEFIQDKPEDTLIKMYFNDMFVNDKKFTITGDG